MSNELVIVENLELVPFFTKGDQVKSILDRLSEEANSFVAGDLSVAKNRKAVTEMVTKFTKSKTYLESKGKELAAEYKAIPKAIDANRKLVKDTITGLQEVVRKPLTDWENEQAAIKAAELAAKEAEELAKQKDADQEMALLLDDNFNREKAAQIAKDEADKLAYEAELKAKAVEQAKADALAETNRVAAENAEKERLAIQREADLKAEAKQAEDRAKQLAIDNKAAEDKRIIDAENAEKQRVIDAENAEARRLSDIETARLSELARQAAEQEQLAKEQKARDDDKEHRASVNNCAASALVEFAGLTVEQAKAVVISLVKNQIPKATLTY